MPTDIGVVGEVVTKRTPFSKHYLLSDGSYRAVISLEPMHYQCESGYLHNIDTDLHDEADFDVVEAPISKDAKLLFDERRTEVAAAKKKRVLDRSRHDFCALKVPFQAVIPRQFRKGYTIGKGADSLTFRPVGVSPTVGRQRHDDRSIVEYQDAWHDTDVTLQITPTGVKETIVLKSIESPTSFTFEVDGDLSESLEAGELQLQDAWLEDAQGVKRDVQQIVRREGERTYLDLIAAVDGLSYPITIDPTVSFSKWNFIVERREAKTWSGLQNAITETGSVRADAFKSWLPATYSYVVAVCLMSFDTSALPDDSFIISASLTVGPDDHYGSKLNGEYWNGATGGFWSIDVGTNAFSTSLSPKRPNTIALGTLGINKIGYTRIRMGLAASNPPTDQNGVVNLAYLPGTPVLEVQYNITPTVPTLLTPNGGETWNALHTITWLAASDPEEPQSSLRYNIQLSVDNGTNWKDIVPLTQAGVTSYSYDFSHEPETSLARVRVRAYDGYSYGPWDESDGVFTIIHNQAPTAPTQLSPSGGAAVDRALTQRLSWKHNDPNSNDPQSKFDLQWRPVGTTTWNPVSQTTPNQYWNAPGNTFPRGNIEWRVRTYDQAGLSGPYSAQATFFAGDKPAEPTIIGPSSPVPIARPTLEWSSFGQTAYQVQVLNTVRVTLWDSGEVISTNKARTIGMDLTNNTSYILRVRIKNADNLWSSWVERTIAVFYTTPPTPLLTVTGHDREGKITVAIKNPAPSGTEPNVKSNDLFRREVGQTEWTRIATGIPVNGKFDDYTVASGTPYEYMARAQGTNGTIKDTHYYQGKIFLVGAWLHCVDDPLGTAHRFVLSSGNSEEWKTEGTLMKFAGRHRPVAEFGENDSGRISVKLKMLRKQEDREILQSIVQRKATVCYRDNRGRKMFGVIFVLPSSDTFYGYGVGISIDEIDYREDV
ncbi:hypothetical protein [Brevibacillus borstelensis]|uniref:glycoside hydrolase family 78 protein n=1 Tax=Brevibacillus borstelensis TaxID=45462 RepID=UPI0030BBF4F6